MFDVPEYRYVGDSVWDAACEINEGDFIEVDYHSKRAMEVRKMEGEVVMVRATDDFCKIEFVRDDGQRCRVESDGGLYSIGSHYPHNGDYTKISIRSN